MDRGDLGTWGVGLSTEEFACAYAALGTLQTLRPDFESVEEVLAERLARDPVTWARQELRSPLRFGAEPAPADLLAAAWSRAVAAREPDAPLRLEVHQDRTDPSWALQQLANPATGVDGLYLRVWTPGRSRWRWPLQVGLLGDAVSARLGAELHADADAVGDMVDLVALGPGARACDLLLLPYSVRDGVREALAHDIRASCVVFLRHPGEPWRRTRPLAEAIAAHLLSAGTAFVAVREGKRAAWLGKLASALAEDVSLDVALFRTSPSVPLLIAERSFLEHTRLKRVAETLRRELTVRGDDEIAFAAPPEEAAEEAIDETAEALNDADFSSYDRPGRLVDAIPAAERAVAERPRARFVQARIFDHVTVERGEHGPLERHRGLVARRPHSILVRIGPPDEDWQTSTDPFPEQALFGPRSQRLTVAFVPLSGVVGEAGSRQVVLPAAGPSSSCRFFLTTGEEQLVARIIVLHENRVLQTAIVRASVVESEDLASDGAPVGVETEALVRLDTSDLDERSRFGATLVLNHDDRGDAGLTKIRNGRVTVVEPDQFQYAVDAIRVMLEEATEAPEGYDQLDAADTVQLLIRLADQGVTLFDLLTDDPGFEAVRDESRIQVVSTRGDAYFPAEFVYAGETPDDDAELCPNAKSALEEGRCPDCRSLTDGSVVCPLSFWGLSKVIERHMEPERGEDEYVPAWQYELRTEPGQDRRRLATSGKALFAASVKVDAAEGGGTAAVAAALRRATGDPSEPVDSWDRWREGVERSQPVLLVLLPHTLMHADSAVTVLEIDEAERLKVTKVRNGAYVRAKGAGPPIAVLLGCKTSGLELPAFQRLSAAFRRGGAAIVVATLTKVLGRHAAPVASNLVELLARAESRSGASFGDVMLAARRDTVRKGRPLAMALVAYGDADWALSPEGSPTRRRVSTRDTVPA